MCVGIPMQIIEIREMFAIATDNGVRHEIDISLIENPQINDFVLVFLGAARHKLEPQEALEIANALDGLRAVFDGQNPDEFFKDLIEREPQLPPHLQNAYDAGLKNA